MQHVHFLFKKYMNYFNTLPENFVLGFLTQFTNYCVKKYCMCFTSSMINGNIVHNCVFRKTKFGYIYDVLKYFASI